MEEEKESGISRCSQQEQGDSENNSSVVEFSEYISTNAENCDDKFIMSHYEKLSTSYLNNSATADESMAIEALSQLGTSTIFPSSLVTTTKTPFDLPLLPCASCNLQFKTTADLQNHQPICLKIPPNFKCQLCSATFERKFDLNNHLVCHSVDRPHSCRICGILFIHKRSLMHHMGSSHKEILQSPNQCQVCGASFTRSSSLTNHMKIHTYQPGRAIIVKSEEISNVQQEVVIKKEPLPSINNIKIGFAWNYPNHHIIKETPDNISVEQEEQINLNDESTGVNVCNYCQKTFKEKKALISHLNIHIILQDIVQCDKCNIYFPEGKDYQNHLKNCPHEIVTLEEYIVDDTPDKKIKKSVSNVAKHLCKDCGKSFGTKQKLQRHMWIHRKKIYTCEICAYTFEHKVQLDGHRLSSHQVTNGYVCNICGKSFTSRQGLWEHNRLHGPTPLLYECKECAKTFTSRQGYLIHKRIHSNERPYGCRFCWKAFRDGGTLRKHERIHTGERPHSCPLCNRAFNQKVVLREHVRWLHAASSTTNSSGMYDCSLCDQVIQDKDELCAHIVKHSDNLVKSVSSNRGGGGAAAAKNRKKKKDVVFVKTEQLTTGGCSLEIDSVESGTVMPVSEDFICDFEENLVYMCELCGEIFRDKKDLSVHVNIHI